MLGSMADTTARLLRLLSLLQAHRSWTGNELMERLEVSERTLRRDIDRLRDLGYPVQATRGPAGGYQLMAGSALPPLVLDDEEAVAVAVSLRTAAGGTISGIEETSVRALAKLEQVLPPAVRRRVNMLQSMVAPVIRSWVTVDADILTSLAQACRDHERVRFEYRSREGEISERNVEPHQLVSVAQRWYLLAYDREREDWRTFRLDRISQPRLTRFVFQPRPIPGGDPGDFVLRSLDGRPMRYQAEVIFAAPADEVRTRMRPHEGTVEEEGSDSTRLSIQGDYLDWLAFRILWFDLDFVLEGPPELVTHMAALTGRMRASLQKSG